MPQSRNCSSRFVLMWYSLINCSPRSSWSAGVFHSVERVGAVYKEVGEPQSWTVRIGQRTVMHAKPGDKLYAFTAVFAPERLSTRIIHDWQWYDPASRTWRTQSRTGFSISGGREGGYRVYSVTSRTRLGDWRVDIETPDGRRLGRIRFRVLPPTGPIMPVREIFK